MAYQFIQLTDRAVGAVATDALLPLGNVTRKNADGQRCQDTFIVSTSGSDTVTITEAGWYKISYVGSLIPADAGEITLSLEANNVQQIAVSDTVAAADDITNISLEFIIRVFPSCRATSNMPVALQIINTGVALTGGTSNLIIEKIR